MKKIFIITGASGFLGNVILRKLESSGCEIRALLLPEDNGISLQGLNCKIYRGNVTEMDTLSDIFDKAPHEELIVIHCAAVVYVKNKPSPQVFRVNVGGTENIVRKCLEKDAKLIYINSVHAIPEPADNSEIIETEDFSQDAVFGIYAKSKAEAAKLVLNAVKHHGLFAIVLQPSGIIGPGDYGVTHMTALIMAVMHGKLPAIVKGGYDFVDVRDVADGILSAIEKGKNGECYILSNRYVELKEIVDLVCRYGNRKKINLTLPLPIAKIMAPLCELYYTAKKQTPLFTRYSLYTLQSKSNFCHDKADNALGYHVRKLEETISDTVEWLSLMK